MGNQQSRSVRRQREQGENAVTARHAGSGWPGLNNLSSGAQGLSLSVWHLALGDEGRWPRVREPERGGCWGRELWVGWFARGRRAPAGC